MAKTSKQFDKSKGVLVIVIALLTLVILALIATYPKNKEATANVVTNDAGGHVSLIAIQYDLSSGRAVKIQDEKLTKLESFLNELARKDKELSPDCASYYSAVAANEDKTQVLLRYGCSSPDSNMFVVYQDNQWQTLTPTNNFDQLPIPLCSHVDDNHITPTLAPVCFNEPKEMGGMPTYILRK